MLVFTVIDEIFNLSVDESETCNLALKLLQCSLDSQNRINVLGKSPSRYYSNLLHCCDASSFILQKSCTISNSLQKC